jgi:hypothetical protein
MSTENGAMPSNLYSNATADHLQTSQMNTTPFIYAAHHPHPSYLSQPPPSATASPYATVTSYHAATQQPTIIPSMQSLTLAQTIPSNSTDMQQQMQSHPVPSQPQAPMMTSPKQDTSSIQNTSQQSTWINVPRPTMNVAQTKSQSTATNGIHNDALRMMSTHPSNIADLLSSSPSIMNSQQSQNSLLSPITIQTSNSNNDK